MSLNHFTVSNQSSAQPWAQPRFQTLIVDGSIEAGSFISDGALEVKGDLKVDGKTNSVGQLTASSLAYPTADALANAKLITNGSGVLSLRNQVYNVSAATAMSIPDSTNTILNTWAVSQSVGGEITLVSTQDFKVANTGFYLVTYSVAFATANNGERNIELLVNGSAVTRGRCTVQSAAAQTAGPNLNGSAQVLLLATNTVSVRVFQSSGGAINATADIQISLL